MNYLYKHIIYNKTFLIDDNEQSIKSIKFKLGDMKDRIELEMEHGLETIEVGYGQYKKARLNETIPFSSNSKKQIGSSGAWITENEYQLRIYFCESPARINYNFKFAEDQLTWKSNADQAMFASGKMEILHGK